LSSRRSPSEIALELLDLIDRDGRASKWELTKVLGNTAQFRHWVDDFLLKDGLISEIQEGRVTYYLMTDRGILFHRLLKNGNIMRSFLRISGKRLSRR
jgi:predicted transcriptional regulator